MFQAKLLIGGQEVSAQGDATYDRLDPITERVATRAASATVGDAVEAANSAAAAFPVWSTSSAAERTAILSEAADRLLERSDEFVAVMAEETGAAESWARFNCQLGADMLRHAAGLTDRLEEIEIASAQSGVRAWAVRQPAGVVLAIAPWNAPVVLGARAVAVALACANTVVLKASEICPRTHAMIAETLNAAGLPAGALNLVTNAPEKAPDVIEALIAHAAVRRVSFTGSTRVGRTIADLCARHLKPCLLELSGKAPLLVLDDADIEEAVKAAAFGAFFNQGQVCISTERLIVDKAVADRFVSALAARAAGLRAGDPRSGGQPLGSMISREAVHRIAGLIDDATAKGARLVAGGQGEGTIMQPTVLDGVTSNMRVYHEESFGPLVAIMRVDGADEAVAVANDSEYGLAASVFGRDIERARAVARRIETGICHVNGPTVYDEPQMPFGGMKASGYGRFGGDAGVQEFTELRWLSVHETAHDYPF